jgi:hypothetical protein
VSSVAHIPMMLSGPRLLKSFHQGKRKIAVEMALVKLVEDDRVHTPSVLGRFFPGIYQANVIEMREQYHRQLSELASHYGNLDIPLVRWRRRLARVQRHRLQRRMEGAAKGSALLRFVHLAG